MMACKTEKFKLSSRNWIGCFTMKEKRWATLFHFWMCLRSMLSKRSSALILLTLSPASFGVTMKSRSLLKSIIRLQSISHLCKSTSWHALIQQQVYLMMVLWSGSLGMLSDFWTITSYFLSTYNSVRKIVGRITSLIFSIWLILSLAY